MGWLDRGVGWLDGWMTIDGVSAKEWQAGRVCICITPPPPTHTHRQTQRPIQLDSTRLDSTRSEQGMCRNGTDLVLVGADELAGVDEGVGEEVDVALLGLAFAPVDVHLGQRALCCVCCGLKLVGGLSTGCCVCSV
jgi:hypothetical protein